MDLTEAADIKKRWQEYTEELYKFYPVSIERLSPSNQTYFYLFLDQRDEIVTNNNVIYLIKLGTSSKEATQMPHLLTLSPVTPNTKGDGE